MTDECADVAGFRGNIEESARIEDTRSASAIGGGSRRSEPEEHLIGPLVEGAIGSVVEVEAVGGLDDSIESSAAGLEPGIELRVGDGAGELWVGRNGLCVKW